MILGLDALQLLIFMFILVLPFLVFSAAFLVIVIGVIRRRIHFGLYPYSEFEYWYTNPNIESLRDAFKSVDE